MAPRRETGAIAIYAAPCWGAPILVAALILTLCLIVLHLNLFLFVPLAIAVATVHDLDNFRRAVIFTPSAVRYRPPFGKLREIQARDIFLVTRTAVVAGPYRSPMRVLAAKLTLLHGETLTIPLSMDKGGRRYSASLRSPAAA
jgi:hypothetical protein